MLLSVFDFGTCVMYTLCFCEGLFIVAIREIFGVRLKMRRFARSVQSNPIQSKSVFSDCLLTNGIAEGQRYEYPRSQRCPRIKVSYLL